MIIGIIKMIIGYYHFDYRNITNITLRIHIQITIAATAAIVICLID